MVLGTFPHNSFFFLCVYEGGGGVQNSPLPFPSPSLPFPSPPLPYQIVLMTGEATQITPNTPLTAFFLKDGHKSGAEVQPLFLRTIFLPPLPLCKKIWGEGERGRKEENDGKMRQGRREFFALTPTRKKKSPFFVGGGTANRI